MADLPDPAQQYTTMTVKEYNHLRAVILVLREQVQRARQYLEKGEVDKALQLLKVEEGT